MFHFFFGRSTTPHLWETFSNAILWLTAIDRHQQGAYVISRTKAEKAHNTL